MPTVLFFGSYDANLHPRVRVLMDGLQALGWEITELNVPLGAATSEKVAAAGSARSAARLARRQASAWRHLAARSRQLGGSDPDVVVVGYLGQGDVHLARVLFRRSVIVLDYLVGLADTASDRGLGGPGRQRALLAADRAALRAADVAVVDTPEQAALLPQEMASRVVVVPVGAGADWFAAGASAAARRTDETEPADPLRVIFFGLFTPLQGTPVIAAALALLADEPVVTTMVGTGQDLAAARMAAGGGSIRWIDWVDSPDLPEFVADHDVCLGIFGTSPKAGRVVPTKVYQGLAAGCAVLTAATPAVAGLGDAVIGVPAGDPAALAQALRGLMTDRTALNQARARARSAAARLTPRDVVAPLELRLRREPPRATLPPLTFNAWLRWDALAAELDRLAPQKVLEIGPGEGAAACRLARGRDYTGIELSERTRAVTEVRLANQGTPGRLLGSMADLDPHEVFELVCAFEVIEHIDDDAKAVAHWAARVAPGGALVLSTPAGPERMAAADVIAGHFRRYSAAGLGSLAQQAGLVDIRVQHVGFPMGYALEAVRNRVAQRRLATQPEAAGQGHDVAVLTEGSSSFLQPPAWAGGATRVATAPGRWVQRRFPDRGTGLVLVARAPRISVTDEAALAGHVSDGRPEHE